MLPEVSYFLYFSRICHFKIQRYFSKICSHSNFISEQVFFLAVCNYAFQRFSWKLKKKRKKKTFLKELCCQKFCIEFWTVLSVKINPQHCITFTFSCIRNWPRSPYSCLCFEVVQALRTLGVQMAIFGTHSCLSKFRPFVYFKKEKEKKRKNKLLSE